MRALKYLTHALRQTIPAPASNPNPSPSLSSSPNPDTTQFCIPGVGLPGGVYLCGSSYQSCQWISPSQARKCIPYDVQNLGPPALIGPDFGGWCKIFKNKNCEEDSGLRVATNKRGDPDETSSGIHPSMGMISCPGIGQGNVPIDMKSFRCFPSDEADHNEEDGNGEQESM